MSQEISTYLIQSTVNEHGVVKAWEETLMLPTYVAGKEEKNPIFLEKRVYQGSSGAVYPYPVVESVSDTKVDKPYTCVFLENEYLKIMVLPELGGRVQMAYDKIHSRHFVYFNQVIKPALVGLTGPWISGGIEFNWPQHHRPSTFLPLDWRIEKGADGSCTVWCSEIERMSRTKGMHGLTLRPAKAFLEINVQIYNRTLFPQTFLWWANPAVSVHEAYHSVFPPDVHAVFDHGKRDVSSFPIATGTYYKQDYSAGVDISRYSNIPVPTSYMAIKSKYDFVGGYDEAARAGLLHVANHHVSPGKKQWTWGNGDFGRAWDRNLTDEDGPYIELMTGVFTDNQPDFSWLQPGEEKSWTQYFMPYAETGYVKNASRDAIVNVETANGKTVITLYTTAVFTGLQLSLKNVAGKIFTSQCVDIKPETPFKTTIETADEKPENLIFELRTSVGALMLRYQADAPTLKPMPESARAAKEPKEINSVEQLFLTGSHLEQYRHATYNPLDYYLEGLRRDEGDVRCNNAVGLFYMKRGVFAKAEPYFRRAIATLTERNPNPYDGEPFYNLGCCLRFLGKPDEAYEMFYKATWNAAWHDAACLALAQMELASGNCQVSTGDNFQLKNHKARHLKAIILRKLGRREEALAWIDESLKIDGFNYGCIFEKNLLKKNNEKLNINIDTAIEYAIDYAYAGQYAEARELLNATPLHATPMYWYYLAWLSAQMGDDAAAKDYYAQAAAASPDRCFPNRIEDVIVLQDAIEQNPDDALALYLLGNFMYAARQYDEAIDYWERSAALNDAFPTVWRNLALAYYNKRNNKEGALGALEKAFALDNTDARILMELDQLYKKLNKPSAERLSFLEKYSSSVEQRDDLYLERITLYNMLGDYAKVRDLLASRHFHPWEGGEGKVTGQYLLCRVQMAKQALAAGNPAEALRLLHEIDEYPHNLGEGKLANAEENDVNYYKGLAYSALGDKEAARKHFDIATTGSSEPQQAFFYNDTQPDRIYYQGLAWRALDNEARARSCFNKLIAHGEKHLYDNCKIDYFAVSLPDLAIWDDDLNRRNRIHCHFVMGLGCLGLGQTAEAQEHFKMMEAI